MAREKNSLLICGPSLSGKTTFGKVLASFLSPVETTKKVVCVDTSDMIKWGKQIENGIGDQIRKYNDLMEAGEFLPDYVMLPLFHEWLAAYCKENHSTKTLIICGMRTVEQLVFREAFDRSAVININTSLKMAAADLERRIAESGSNIRADDARGLEVLTERYRKYEKYTFPVINKLGNDVLHLERSAPLCDRLEQTFKYLMALGGKSPIKTRLARRALGRLHEDKQKISDLYPSDQYPPDIFDLLRSKAKLNVGMPHTLGVTITQNPFAAIRPQAAC